MPKDLRRQDYYYPTTPRYDVRPAAELSDAAIAEPRWHEVTTRQESPVVYYEEVQLEISVVPGNDPGTDLEPSESDELRAELWPLLEPRPAPRTA